MTDNTCLHDFKYERVDGDGYASKWATCLKCGLKQTIYKEVGKAKIDPMQKYYDQMFRCFDAVTAKYPEMAESSRKEMAVSLFIQTGGRI